MARARGVPRGLDPRASSSGTRQGRQFGFFGEPRVNVLLLNIALDSVVGVSRRSGSRLRVTLSEAKGRSRAASVLRFAQGDSRSGQADSAEYL